MGWAVILLTLASILAHDLRMHVQLPRVAPPLVSSSCFNARKAMH